MTIDTAVILWVLVIVMAFAASRVRLSQKISEDVEGLEKTDFRELSYNEFPRFVKFLLAKHRRRAEDLGFTELVCFTRTKLNMPNFTCIFISADRRTTAEIEYVRWSPEALFMMLFVRPSHFVRFILGAYGLVLSTACEDERRFGTTQQAFLGEHQVEGEKELIIVPAKIPMREMYVAHLEGVARFCSKYSLTPRQFVSKEDYFSFERRDLQKLASKFRNRIGEMG